MTRNEFIAEALMRLRAGNNDGRWSIKDDLGDAICMANALETQDVAPWQKLKAAKGKE